MEAESSLWATLGCGVFFGPSASHGEEQSHHIERAEVKQCVKNSKKKKKRESCSLQLLSVVFILYFLIFDWDFGTSLLLAELHRGSLSCQIINFQQMHSGIHIQQSALGILEDWRGAYLHWLKTFLYSLSVGKYLSMWTQSQYRKLSIWQPPVTLHMRKKMIGWMHLYIANIIGKTATMSLVEPYVYL